MVKGSNSLFDVFSKILENLNEYFKSRFIQKKKKKKKKKKKIINKKKKKKK